MCTWEHQPFLRNNEYWNWKSETVAFGSDGASVYVGRLNSVVAKLHVEIPWLLGVHCIAHRLELSVLDALKDEEQLKNVQEMFQGLYKHYHYSPKGLRELNLHNYWMRK